MKRLCPLAVVLSMSACHALLPLSKPSDGSTPIDVGDVVDQGSSDQGSPDQGTPDSLVECTALEDCPTPPPCNERACTNNKCELVPVADGMKCADNQLTGICHTGVCCTGCTQDGLCQSGDSASACGKEGEICSICGGAAECVVPVCAAGFCGTTKKTLSPCQKGVLKGVSGQCWFGTCCDGCWADSACHPGNELEYCGPLGTQCKDCRNEPSTATCVVGKCIPVA